MRVGILGAGNVAFATAALLAERGHAPTVWSPSGGSTAALADRFDLAASGALAASVAVSVARTIDSAAEADVIFFAVPGYGLRSVIDAYAPVARASHSIVMAPTIAAGPLALSRALADRGLALPIVALGTTIATSRRTAAAAVQIFSVRSRIACAALPRSGIDGGLRLAVTLFGERFAASPSVIATALSNPNPVFHVPLVLANLTRIDQGMPWTQYDSMSASVARIAEAIDRERLAVAKALAIEIPSIHEHFASSFGVPLGGLAEQSRAVHATLGSPAGPTTLEHRYLTEDVPYGLAFVSGLGRILATPTPITDACIALASNAIGRDLRAADDLFAPLGVESPAGLAQLLGNR